VWRATAELCLRLPILPQNCGGRTGQEIAGCGLAQDGALGTPLQEHLGFGGSEAEPLTGVSGRTLRVKGKTKVETLYEYYCFKYADEIKCVSLQFIEKQKNAAYCYAAFAKK
jgi:hypothetical protein